MRVYFRVFGLGYWIEVYFTFNSFDKFQVLSLSQFFHSFVLDYFRVCYVIELNVVLVVKRMIIG